MFTCGRKPTARHGSIDRASIQVDAGRLGNRLARGPHATLDVAARGLRGFDVGVQRPVPALGVEVFHQRQQHGGFARLARRMQHKVALGLDQRQHVVHVHPRQRVEHVVVLGA
ncbi:hypothetical protein [Tepidimonas ignava]|uniref:hypothetical protein n=1 Tax=Tepidimonas ignava TaxID=114249 RepID=UPI0014052064|nr:hypothetical protein [Tepidimonas ignava]